MECCICKHRGTDSDDTDQHFLFSTVSELFPDCQPPGRSLIERDPGWRNPFVLVFIHLSSGSMAGIHTGISDPDLKWIHRQCFPITGRCCRTFGILDTRVDTGLFYYFLFLPVSDTE